MLKNLSTAVAVSICLWIFLTISACDLIDDDNGTMPFISYGQIEAEDNTYKLGYGEMVVAPSPDGYQTVIELFTSEQARDSGNADMVGITLYHSDNTAPEDDYSVFDLIDNIWDYRYVCNVIINSGKNFGFETGTLSFERTATGIKILLEGTAICTTDLNSYPVRIEYNGPITRLN